MGRQSRQVSVGEPTEHVGELDHGRRPRSEPGHQLVEEGSELELDRLGQMRVDGGGGDALVAEQDLQGAQVDAVFDSRVA